jgi:hypothetical protein
MERHRLMKGIKTMFCIKHEWSLASKEKTGRQMNYKCKKCGKEDVIIRPIPVLFPEQFRGNKV